MRSGIGFIGVLLFALSLPAAARADWKGAWEKTVAAAKEEGRIVIYTFPGQERLFREFQNIRQVFPGPSFGKNPGDPFRSADGHLDELDVGELLLMGGAGSAAAGLLKGGVLDPITPVLLLPEVLDQSRWWRGRHIYGDDQGTHILAFSGAPLYYFHYNASLVNPQEFKSYRNFLDPKWKGKIVIAEPLTGGTQEPLQFLYNNREIGPDFVRRFLTEMDVTVSRDIRQMVDWVAHGKYAISALQNADRLGIWEAKKQGLPVSAFATEGFKEGGLVGSGGGNIMLINRAPHPDAARVFINWLLSREGQIAYQKFVPPGRNSLRIDIPKDDVPEHARIVPGANYALLDDPGYSDLETVRRFVGEVWQKKR